MTVNKTAFEAPQRKEAYDASNETNPHKRGRRNEVLSTAAATVSPPARAVGWKGGAVSGTVGTALKAYPCLAYASIGQPQIAYCDYTNGDLWHSARAGRGSHKKVDSTGKVGFCCALALKSDLPWISYYDATNSDLKCAWLDGGGTWHIERVDTAGDVGSWTSISVSSSDGQPCISYCDWTNHALKYAYRTASGTWVNTTVDTVGAVGRDTSIAVKRKSKEPAISYWDETPENNCLKYAWKNARTGEWKTEFVDRSPSVGWYTSLAFTVAGKPCISYYDYGNGALKYAEKAGGRWHYATCLQKHAGQCTSLALSNKGLPRISHVDGTNHRVLFTWKDTTNAWNTEVVAEESVISFCGTSIAVHPATGKTGISAVAGYKDPSGVATGRVYWWEKTAVVN